MGKKMGSQNLKHGRVKIRRLNMNIDDKKTDQPGNHTIVSTPMAPAKTIKWLPRSMQNPDAVPRSIAEIHVWNEELDRWYAEYGINPRCDADQPGHGGELIAHGDPAIIEYRDQM